MLQVKNLKKEYKTGNLEQIALNDVSINFRENEFVAILGPSGSGKTTLLNIIGGLDRYDSGDIIINNISTKKYSDKDWDSYRNHSVGFVFQNYNLISHQTVLANVELALTLSGISKSKRRKMAQEALEKVGLGDQSHKKPNQMSGGQMQRVAIARALVNNPDIVLADEPTGALDTETSVQIMDLLKEVAKDRLVIMVTHNPELAEEYANRIIRVKDGKILEDTNPLKDNENKKEIIEHKNLGKSSMSFWTALTLSFNNLLTKKGRTALTSFAGSIGIIGIALILAISTGVQNYIDAVQQDTLSSFPIQIEKESTDMSAILESMMGTDSENGDIEDKGNRDAVYGNPVMYKMMKSMLNAETTTNNLKDLKTYLDKNKDEINQYSTAIQYGYDIKLNVYATDPNGEYAKADFIDLMNGVIEGGDMMAGISSVMENAGGMTVWQELLTDPQTGEISNLIDDQYDLVYGNWPKEKDEIMLVLNKNNEISDITLYSLGLVDKQTMMNSTLAAMMGKEDNSWEKYEGMKWSYEEICNIPLKMILPTDYYQFDESTKLWVDISENQALLNSVINKGTTLKIVGIVKPSEDATATFLEGSLCYTHKLTEYYMETLNNTEMVKQQKENKDSNIISGLPFIIEEKELSDDEKVKTFKDYVKELTDNEKATLYESILAKPKESFIKETIDKMLENYQDKTAEEIVEDITKQYADELGYSEELIHDMLGGYNKEELLDILEETIREMIITQFAENASDTINEIHSTPSDAEIKSIKEMVLSEMYKDIANMPTEQQTIMKQQINVGFVAQNWASKTGMSVESAMGILATMQPTDFEKAFETALTETASTTFAQYGGTSSSSENATKVAKVLDEYLAKSTNEDFIYFYENHMPDKVSDKSHSDILKSLGVKTPEDPDFIYIYPVDFEKKENIANMIQTYNDGVAEENKIEYTDVAAMLMSSVSNIITAISVVLICFVSISLIVSSIMIGIITYISVLERTKEIGVLRAIGASKKDITRVFNAETMIVGLLAGIVGIVSTILLCIPISIIARDITGIASLTAVLPWYGYLLVVLSVGLTLIAGLFPSRMAAKKDPVIALRSE